MTSNKAKKVLLHLNRRPRSASELSKLTKLTEKSVRDGIDELRRGEAPVWHSQMQRGFWVDGSGFPKAPPDRSGGRWKKEPEGYE